MFFMMSVDIIKSENQSSASILSLIEYSKKRDIYFFELNKRIPDLWKLCTIEIDLSDSNYHRVHTYVKNFVSKNMLQDLYNSRQELKDFQKNTENDIAQLIQDGQSIHAVDEHGNTSLDYVQSRPVYNALRSQGADFQIFPFLSLNKWYIATALIPITLAAVGLYQAFYSNRRNEHINDQDYAGRTALMNYVIEQEIMLQALIKSRNLYALKAKIKEIMENLLILMKQGADIDITDHEGKTVLDYCQTPFIYDCCTSYTLRNSEKKIEMNACLFFASVIIPVYAIIGLAMAYPAKGAGDAFDTWYKQRYL